VARALRLFDEPGAYATMSRAHNPYGDGRAADRIVKEILRENRF
ncbi:MAG TPA: UDP-N-acetylglucosamine 2-epimerase (non-hydrolyzing), partial [Rhodospirillales bacterium]|nr:UDP-N-acetylglucosamine 2-epimerase (non-hydrolyzing) [Rhodospirillales bacterium]